MNPNGRPWSAELAGDQASVFVCRHAFQDVHHIQASPSLIAQVRRADLVICTGADLEIGWLPVLLTRAATTVGIYPAYRVFPGIGLCAADVVPAQSIAPWATFTRTATRISSWTRITTLPIASVHWPQRLVELDGQQCRLLCRQSWRLSETLGNAIERLGATRCP